MSTRIDNAVSILMGIAALTVAIAVGYRAFGGPAVEPGPMTPRAATPPLDESDWAEMMRLARPVIGESSDRIVVIEFTDLECPACRMFHAALRRLPADSLAGVRFLVMHFPLPNHRFALPAARALECAAEADHTLAFVDAVYAHQDSVGLLSWGTIAHRAGIPDTASIADCAADPTPVFRIEESLALGNRIGVQETPVLFVDGLRLPRPTTNELLRALAAARGFQ